MKYASRLVTTTTPKRCSTRFQLVTIVLVSCSEIQASQAISAGYTAMGYERKHTSDRPMAEPMYHADLRGMFARITS